jgi:hypothetical protein
LLELNSSSSKTNVLEYFSDNIVAKMGAAKAYQMLDEMIESEESFETEIITRNAK